MANIQNLDAQQLVGFLRLKFGNNILIKTAKSTAGQGIRHKWAQKGEIKATYKGNDFKILFNTDSEFSSISFSNGIDSEHYNEFVTLMDAIMGQGASLRYSNGAIVEWINDVQLAKKRYEKISTMLEVEVLREDLKKQLPVYRLEKVFSNVEQAGKMQG